MADVFTVKGTVSLDPSDFHTGVEKTVQDGKKLADSIENQSNSIQSFMRDAFSFSAGSMISDGLKQAAQALKEFAEESISIASDLQEVQNVVDVTFGEAASQLEQWASASRTQFGLTELQAKQYASTMGAMLKSMGMGEAEVYSMSTAMAGLAADMASFYNLDFDEAFSKIRSGISGETEPLKQLGINMSVANLEAYALSLGITQAYESMTQAEQAFLRYNYLLETTADAQGDFARTSDSYANNLRTLETNLNSLKAALGEKLLPVINDGITMLNGLFDKELSLSDAFASTEAAFENNAQSIAMNDVKANALINTLDMLSQKESLTEIETAQWNAAVQDLIAIYPSLTGMIGSNTGELNSSIEAIRNETAALKESALEKAKIAAMQEKVDAWAAKAVQAGTAMVEYEKSNAEYLELLRQRESLFDEIAQRAGLTTEALLEIAGGYNVLTAYQAGTSDEAVALVEAYNALIDTEPDLSRTTFELGLTYKSLQDECDAAETEVNDLKEKLEDMKWSAEGAGEGAENLGGNLGNTATNTSSFRSELEKLLTESENAKTLFDELEQYKMNNFQNIAKNVEGLYGTFDKADRVRSTSYSKMSKNVNSQIEQSDRWLKAWNDLQAMGADDTLMSQFDYSPESIAQMEALIKKGPEGVAAMSDQLQTIAGKQAEIASVMSAASLAVDSEYQTMTTAAQTAAAAIVASMTEIQTAGDTLAVKEWKPTINAVDNATSIISAIKTELESLDGKTVTAYINATASDGDGEGGGDGEDGSHATGLHRVPFDNYIARLHADEAVLTKNEADQWRKGKLAGNGGQVVNVTQNISAVPMSTSELIAETKFALSQMRFAT